ncbi:hypothetical protein LCGC14_1866170 [marine sediment metagenome]|uniref:Uncharacterized protein n=1 Tax=marine sediment metagenome TaxID=412755 RepID=A0A0F9G6A8_9ZZZZ
MSGDEHTQKSARQEARKFVGSGTLRDALKSCNYSISDEAIQKIIDACSFVFKV